MEYEAERRWRQVKNDNESRTLGAGKLLQSDSSILSSNNFASIVQTSIAVGNAREILRVFLLLSSLLLVSVVQCSRSSCHCNGI